jgi:ABC-type phosphate transport system auxiliary subunit
MAMKAMKTMKAMKAMKEAKLKQFKAARVDPEVVARREALNRRIKKLHNKLDPNRHKKPVVGRVQLERELAQLKKERDGLIPAPSAPAAAPPAAPAAPAAPEPPAAE